MKKLDVNERYAISNNTTIVFKYAFLDNDGRSEPKGTIVVFADVISSNCIKRIKITANDRVTIYERVKGCYNISSAFNKIAGLIFNRLSVYDRKLSML